MHMLCISTSPPSNYDFDESKESSYYCNVHEVEDWKNVDIVASHKFLDVFPGYDKVQSALIVAQCLFDGKYKEIGILLQFVDEEGEIMYYGIDHSGESRAEPAVNEAAWHIAIAGEALAEGHRLGRIS